MSGDGAELLSVVPVMVIPSDSPSDVEVFVSTVPLGNPPGVIVAVPTVGWLPTDGWSIDDFASGLSAAGV
jgi:hypothetical protein